MEKRKRVFIAGSRHLSRLGNEVVCRIDNIVDNDFTVLIGDANGVDKAVQSYLDRKRYKNVVVFCMEGKCRNNVGRWATESIDAAEPSRHDFSYFSTKDRVMAKECDYGLMLWDGKSRGTLTSIVDLVKQEKPVVVYVAGSRSFFTLKAAEQLVEMLKQVAPSVLQKLEPSLAS